MEYLQSLQNGRPLIPQGIDVLLPGAGRLRVIVVGLNLREPEGQGEIIPIKKARAQ